ncbi:hypothetical protein DRE_07337 [Drechslerella stenobrocha 248]|uniref:Uncharacterized protein n=1 Tax=Drechslerella stenobrocha 248 TaxID=1043628 RepID=W7HUQ7_9PEZI|nr:hypothetical protein DRE_07337 [Drechslerella stenobrocha 248]
MSDQKLVPSSSPEHSESHSAASIPHSAASSACSFRTAADREPDGLVEGGEAKGKEPESNVIPPTSSTMVLHSDPNDCYPIDIYAPPARVTSFQTTLDCTNATPGAGCTNTKTGAMGSTIHSKYAPTPPPKPFARQNAVQAQISCLQGQEQISGVPKQPTMLLFMILATRDNHETRKCEYTIRYKSSQQEPRFPNCPAKEGVFPFEALCPFKAVVYSMRLFHTTNPFKAKDMRVDDKRYRMSCNDHAEVMKWNWPKCIEKEWSRCLIWDGDFPKAE